MSSLDAAVANALADMLPGSDAATSALRERALPIAVFLLDAPTDEDRSRYASGHTTSTSTARPSRQPPPPPCSRSS